MGDIEDKVEGLGREVSTLTGVVGQHINQYSEDSERRDKVAEKRHEELMDGMGTLGIDVGKNTRKLRDQEVAEEAVEKEREKTGMVGGFPDIQKMNGKAKIATGVGLTAALALAYDIFRHVFDAAP